MPAAMDRHRRQRIERAVDCPTCLIGAGARCIDLDSKHRDPHMTRVRAYKRAHPRGGSDAARTIPVALGDMMPQYRALPDGDKARVREAMARAGRRGIADIRNGRRG